MMTQSARKLSVIHLEVVSDDVNTMTVGSEELLPVYIKLTQRGEYDQHV